MFTGIVETIGTIVGVKSTLQNTDFVIKSPISSELKIDQSVSHNGVCLTVVEANAETHRVTAIKETLSKSDLGTWKEGGRINLERCMLNNGRLDGHIVQGHVDQTGLVTHITEQQGSWLFDIEYDAAVGNITVEKGSIAVNGVSLTCFNTKGNGFSVAIIPYTFEHTNFQDLKVGSSVNLEFDIIGKYVKRLMELSR
ncbi:MAG TPA: riboflavin synthase [Chryseosolibacter sp.]|nr:riboflavin synthase [Chryseosolibacter sp.]